MDALASLSFRSADLLWLLAAIPVVALFFVARERTRQRHANRFVSERLRGVSNPARFLRPFLLTAGFVCAVIAVAGPQYGFVLRSVAVPETNRVILLDASQSMGAVDVGTSRMDAGIAIAKKIINAEEGRVGLILFEGDAEVVSPLTDDLAAVVTLLETFSPGELTEPGSDMGRALQRARELIPPQMARSTEFVLISDGEERGGNVSQAIEDLRTAGIRVSTVMVGTTEGTTIPVEGGRVLRDDGGSTVITRARRDTLQEIAQETGGAFYENPFGALALRRLAAAEGRTAQGGPRRVPVERYQWPLGIAFCFFALGSLAHRGAEC